ncbi:MAG TPA: hypothetical protein VGN84_07455 [Solirubrobacterales bacterium]|nr:hypothetical protein [Solirubrobacterales bacterium]
MACWRGRDPARRARSRSGVAAGLALFLCVLLPSPAAASPQGIGAQASALARSPGAKALQAELGSASGLGSAAELARFQLSGKGPALSPFDKSLSRLTLTLLAPDVRAAFRSLASHRRPTRAQARALKQGIEAIAHNRAIGRLQAQGERLKRHPTQLRRAIAALAKRTAGPTDDPPPAGAQESLFARIEAAFTDRALGVHGESLAASMRKLLSSPGAVGYLRSWPPLALSSLLAAPGATPHSRASASAGPGSDADSRCSIAEAQAGIYLSAGVGKALTDYLLGRLTDGTGPPEIALKVAKQTGWAHTSPTADAIGDLIPLYSQGASLGKYAYAVAYAAAVHCYAEQVRLVPAKMSRMAGEVQLYNLLAFNAKGREIAAVPPDSMQIGNGECSRGYPDWECFGEAVGTDPVLARFGDLPASGELTVKPGRLHSLKLSPSASKAGIDEPTAPFSIVGKDFFGNRLPVEIGSLGGNAHLSIAPEGKCDDLTRTCVAQVPGPHAVTVQLGSIGDVAEVKVLPNELRLAPATATVSSGGSQAYAVTEASAGGKALRPVPIGNGPTEAKLSIAPSGSCDQAAGSCTAYSFGSHTVTAETGTATGTALLEVEREGHDQCLPAEAAEGEGEASRALLQGEVNGAASASPAWSAPFDVSPTFEVAQQPQLAEDASGDAVIAWNGLGVRAATRSADGPWSVLQLGSLLNGDGNAPQVAMDKAGDWTAAWEYASSFGGEGYSGVRSIQCVAGSLGNPVTLAPPHYSSDPYEALDRYEPAVAMGGNGSAAVVWYMSSKTLGGESPGVTEVEAATSTPGGAWGSPSVLPGSSEVFSDFWRPAIAADEGGDVTAIWPGLDGPTCVSMISASRPAGSGWSSAVTLAAAKESGCDEPPSKELYEPRLAMNEAGYGVGVWSLLQLDGGSESSIGVAESVFGGGWSATTLAANQYGVSAREPDVATNSSRESVAVWLQNLKLEAASKDSGSPWSAPVGLDGQAGGAEVPEVAIDDAGDAVVVWASGQSEVKAAYRSAGGAWGPATTLSSTADNHDGLPQVAIDAGGSALAVWEGAGKRIEAAELKP